MKKMISLAIVACLAIMTVGFSSCERTADPNVYPVAGHTYGYSDDNLNVQFRFDLNFTATMTRLRPNWIQVPLSWSMSGNKVTLKLMTAAEFGAPINGILPAGTVYYEGIYDPKALTLSLTSPLYENDTPLLLQYIE